MNKKVCPVCKHEVDVSSKFCTMCGYSFAEEETTNDKEQQSNEEQEVKNAEAVEEPVKEQVEQTAETQNDAIEETVTSNENESVVQEKLETPEVTTENPPVVPVIPVSVETGNQVPETKKQKDKKGLLSMIFGIASIPTSFIFIGIVPAILGVVFGLMGFKKGQKGKRIAGIVCGAIGILIFALMIVACSGGHEHEFTEATCTEPATCTICGEVDGEALGHDWAEATCTEPKTCKRCGETEGEALGHDWADATCTEPKTCTRCGETEGEALGHQWIEATCTEAKTCKVCGATEGEPLGHQTNVSCTEEGVCERCGEVVPALGHDWAEATCTEPKTCKRCGETEGEALGHTTDSGICDRCGLEVYATVTGRGDDVITGVEVGDGIYRVHFTNKGRSNFIVHSIDASGNTEHLINEIGNYDGYVFLLGDAPFTFEIKSKGDWSFTIERLAPTEETSFEGTGDYVTNLFDGSDVSGVWEFTHDGSSNFIVHLWTTNGRDHLVNEIGSYSGKVLVNVPADSFAMLEITADGHWTAKPAQ